MGELAGEAVAIADFAVQDGQHSRQARLLAEGGHG
jgi:hypothetical protein